MSPPNSTTYPMVLVWLLSFLPYESYGKIHLSNNLLLLFLGLWSGRTSPGPTVFLNPPITDIVSLLTVIGLSYSTCGQRSTWPTLLRTLVNDSALYFLVVLASHIPVAVSSIYYLPPV